MVFLYKPSGGEGGGVSLGVVPPGGLYNSVGQMFPAEYFIVTRQSALFPSPSNGFNVVANLCKLFHSVNDLPVPHHSLKGPFDGRIFQGLILATAKAKTGKESNID